VVIDAMKTSSLRIVVLMAIIAPFLVFHPTVTKAAMVTVKVANGGFFFTPSSVTIHTGDSVLWTWSSSGHSTTSGSPGTPSGLWDSGILNQGAIFMHTFNTAGSFSYYCTPHGACCGMVGTVIVSNSTPTPSPTPTPTPTPAVTARLGNISTRGLVQTGSGVTVAGFIVTGTDSKTVVLRGVGPTLSQPPFNIPGTLADPTLQLFDGNQNPIWFNDNWKDTQQTQIQATGHAPPNDFESAILQVLPPGNYTAILSGKNGTTGVGLVEVYDISPGVFAELTNVSTRGFVGTGQQVMIGGFITSGGNGAAQVVVRGLGPTLSQPPFNLSGTLADPVVTLVDGNGNVVQNNNDWKNTQQPAIQATGLAPPNDLDAAILATVAAGHYTAILSGNGGGTGIGLVEVYKLR
jgi:plastocyanin